MLSLVWNLPRSPLPKQCIAPETGGTSLFPLDQTALHPTGNECPAETDCAALRGHGSSEEKGQSEEPLGESNAVRQPGAGKF